MLVKPGSPKINWPGAVSLQKKDNFIRPWRLVYNDFDIFVDAEELLDYLPDQLHPDAEGIKIMTQNFINEVKKLELKV